MSLLRPVTRHDFQHDKLGTVMRRVERRLQINGKTKLARLAKNYDMLGQNVRR
jgi:hypothetical protein